MSDYRSQLQSRLTQRVLVGEGADHEVAPDGRLHHLRPRIPEELGELLRAVHDRVVDDLRVGEQEGGVRVRTRPLDQRVEEGVLRRHKTSAAAGHLGRSGFSWLED